MKSILFGLVVVCVMSSVSLADDMKLPPLVPQSDPQKLVDEHLDALNACDWNRLMAQYPDDVHIILPDGGESVGREAVGKLFAGFCKSKADGGLNALKFSTLSTFTVGGTLNVQWVADAEFLAEPYKGADAYVMRDGLMAAQVTTFDGSKLKFK